MAKDPFTEFLIRHPRLGEEVFRLNEEGQESLHRGRLKEAERKFHEALSICEYAIPVLNNLALISYVKKDFRRTVKWAKRVLEYHPKNIFAHCTLAESFAELDQRARALTHIERALELFEEPSLPTTFDHLNKLIEALGVLELDHKIYELYQAYGKDEDFESYASFEPLVSFRFGVAAANLGHLKEALALWKRSWEAYPGFPLNEFYIAAARLVRAGKAPPFRFGYAYESFGEFSKLEPRHPPPEVKAFLVATIWEGEEELRRGAIDFLSRYDDPWAEEFLFLLLRQPELPDSLKMQAGMALIERGAITEDEEVEMHLKGELRRVVLTKTILPEEPPPEAMELLEEGLRLKGEGNLKGAERAYRKALELYPILSPAKVNLANILRFTGRLEEAEQLLEEVLELEDAPIARLNLAALYLQRKEYDQAREVLQGLSPAELREEGLPIYYQLQGYIQLEEGEFAEAERAFGKALWLDPQNKAIERELAHLRELRGIKEGFFKRWKELWKRRRERYLRVPVSHKIPLERALANLTRENLMGMARELGLPYGGLKKQALIKKIAGYLAENVDKVYKNLKPREKKALQWVLKRGGSAEYQELIKRYGSTARDSIDWYFQAPSSVVGRLSLMGFLFTGKDEQGKTIAVIPQEIVGQLTG